MWNFKLISIGRRLARLYAVATLCKSVKFDKFSPWVGARGQAASGPEWDRGNCHAIRSRCRIASHQGRIKAGWALSLCFLAFRGGPRLSQHSRVGCGQSVTKLLKIKNHVTICCHHSSSTSVICTPSSSSSPSSSTSSSPLSSPSSSPSSSPASREASGLFPSSEAAGSKSSFLNFFHLFIMLVNN